jgi:hypothetical protein
MTRSARGGSVGGRAKRLPGAGVCDWAFRLGGTPCRKYALRDRPRHPPERPSGGVLSVLPVAVTPGRELPAGRGSPGTSAGSSSRPHIPPTSAAEDEDIEPM